MDLQDILSEKINALPDGPHMTGLRSVKAHIDAAARHLNRGEKEPDESLFTDAIYRCNQAFEGSIKEAYRVLAEKDPKNKKPFEIEQYLENKEILKKRVLDQFKNYRQEWRNPSTHDYTLDFNYDEALLAISSVSGFAIVLSDQISGKFAFDAAAAEPTEPPTELEKSAPLLDVVSARVAAFAEKHIDKIGVTNSASNDYYRLESALAGFLSSALSGLPNVTVFHESMARDRRVDIIIERDDERIAIDVKRSGKSRSVRIVTRDATVSAINYLEIEGITGSVAFVYSIEGGAEYKIASGPDQYATNVRVVAPRSEKGDLRRST